MPYLPAILQLEWFVSVTLLSKLWLLFYVFTWFGLLYLAANKYFMCSKQSLLCWCQLHSQKMITKMIWPAYHWLSNILWCMDLVMYVQF